MTSRESALHVEVLDDEIVITLPGTNYAVTYYRAIAFPQRLLTKSHSGGEDHDAPITQAEFHGRAWRLANEALTPRGALPFGSPSCAAAYSGEPLRSDENEASVIKARTSVVSIACDLLNKLAIGLEDLFVSALEVNAFGKISQRLVAHPAKNWALPIRHPELDTVAGRQVINVPL